MAHEKCFAVCENKCFVETLPKTAIEEGFDELELEVNNKQSKILSGTSTPSSSLGNDGDIYLKYEA